MGSDSSQGYREFPLTRWSLVDKAASVSSDAGYRALEELADRYRPALKAHLTYNKKLSPDRADDLIQGFLADKVLEGDLLAHADRAKGRFRTYLLTAMDRYIVSVVRKESAKKRSPGEGMLQDLEGVESSAVEPQATSNAYDVAWARGLIDETLRRVRNELESAGRASYWRIFEARVVGPILEGTPEQGYEALVEELGFPTPMQASNALITAKRTFVRRLREVVGEYAEDDVAIEKEIQELQAILAGSSK